MPSVAITETSSLFPSKKSTKRRILVSSVEEYITQSSNLDANLCLNKMCLSIDPSQTVSLDLMNSDLTSKLTKGDPLGSENILKLLKIGHYGITMDPTEMLNQNKLLGMQEHEGSQTPSKLHARDGSLDFELNLQSHPETMHSSDLKSNLPPSIDSTSDFSEVSSHVIFSAVSASQSFPIQTSVPMSVLTPDWTYTDYLNLTSYLKENTRTSSKLSKWELQPSGHGQESPAASQRISITRSLSLSSLEPIPASPWLKISGK